MHFTTVKKGSKMGGTKGGGTMSGVILTQGRIDRQLIRLALPLLAGNLIQQFYNTVDMMIVGKAAGDGAFSAVGVAGSVMNLFTHLLIGFSVGFSILYANAYGAEDDSRLRKCLFTTGVITVGVTLTLSVGGLLFLRPILTLIQTPAELQGDCARYLVWIFGGLLFTGLYNLLAALLRAVGRTNVTLYALAAAMVCNIGLDLLLVAGLRMGVAGAALATVLSQALSTLLCGGYLFWRYPELRLTRRDLVFQNHLFRQSAQYGSLSALQQSSLYCGKLLIQSAINAMGAVAITAYTAASCVENLFLAFGDSGAAALSVFVAQNVGARRPDRMREGMRRGLRLMMGTSVALSLLLAALRRPALSLLISAGNTDALQAAGTYLGVMCPLYLLSFWGNSFQGYFRGLGRMSAAFCATILQITLRVLFTYLLPAQWGLLSVALATGLGWGAMVALQGWMSRRHRLERAVLHSA